MAYAPKRPNLLTVQQQQQEDHEKREKIPVVLDAVQIATLRKAIEEKLSAKPTKGWIHFINQIITHLMSDETAYFFYEGTNDALITLGKQGDVQGSPTVLEDFVERKIPTHKLYTLFHHRYVFGKIDEKYKISVYYRVGDIFNLRTDVGLYDIGTVVMKMGAKNFKSAFWKNTLKNRIIFRHDALNGSNVTAYLGKGDKNLQIELDNGFYLMDLCMESLSMSDRKDYYVKFSINMGIPLAEDSFQFKLFQQPQIFNHQLFFEIGLTKKTNDNICPTCEQPMISDSDKVTSQCTTTLDLHSTLTSTSIPTVKIEPPFQSDDESEEIDISAILQEEEKEEKTMDEK